VLFAFDDNELTHLAALKEIASNVGASRKRGKRQVHVDR